MNQSETDLMQYVALDKIVIGEINPRKEIDPASITELATSIKVHGVIQPVLLRPNGKEGHYELIAGQRRLLASREAGLEVIPATIRIMNDEQAIEAAVIENLQRKDVQPWEESVAYRMLVDKQKLTVTQIADRVGKTTRYISKLLTLAFLIPDFFEGLKAGHVKIQLAMRLAQFNDKVQTKLFKDHGYNVYDWHLNELTTNLKNAKFDTEDATLDKKMGACTTCQFNSANSLLFAEANDGSICGKPECFQKKSEVSFKRKFKEAKEDPTVKLITSRYGSDSDLVKDLKKEGIEVVNSESLTIVEKPEEPDYNDYLDEDLSPEENETMVAEAKEEFEKEIAEYNRKIEAGEYAKGLVIEGNGSGQEVLLDMSKKKKDAKKGDKPEKVTNADIEEEIEGIRKRTKRAAELDGEKVFAKILEAFEKHPMKADLKTKMNAVEEGMMYYFLAHNCGFGGVDKIRKAIKPGRSVQEEVARYMKLTDGEKAFIVRNAFLHEYPGNHPRGGDGVFRYKLAESWKDIPVKEFEKEQKEIRDKREARAGDRIGALKEKLKPETKKKKDVKSKK